MMTPFDDLPAGRHAHSLSEVNALIRETIELTFPDILWVVAEISEIRSDSKGHRYLNLVEKADDRVLAKAQANIWNNVYRTIIQKFEKAAGQGLKQGMKILFAANVEFHVAYGMSLNIKDIDPTYSLGEMARKKKETIKRLKEEGLIDLNKALQLPLVPQRIAVVSSAGAAGYGDFVHQIENNQHGYLFSLKLFQSLMQGERAEASIISSLSRISTKRSHYDAVVMIRGGGSQTDLSCFDSYGLAREVARFPLPVITGIGHERDATVVDVAAHTRMKTPTAVAEFLISGIREFEDRVLSSRQVVIKRVSELLREEDHRLRYIVQQFSHLMTRTFHEEQRRIHSTAHRLSQGVRDAIHAGKTRLDRDRDRVSAGVRSLLQFQGEKVVKIEQAVRLLDPVNILKRGYSITFCKGGIVKDRGQVRAGDTILTKLYQGEIRSIVEDGNGKE